MLKRIKLIQGIGTFTQTRPSGIELSNVTIIYGENRYGKSTLCEIMRSLAEDQPNLIMDRQSIPSDSNKPPKVDIQFNTSNGNILTTFEEEQWTSKLPDCSKMYVFDQSFIHRNVITGQKLERPNSENMTSFILGESNTVLFEELAEMNISLREERKKLVQIEEQFLPHAVGNVHTYSSSALPIETNIQLREKVANLEATKQQTLLTIKNIDQIKNRKALVTVGDQVDFDTVCKKINSTLASNLQNVHQESLTTLQSHMDSHVNNTAIFKGWAGQGLTQIIDDCPFCGQELKDDARSLITAYQQTFNDEFDKFNLKTQQDLNNLRQPFNVPNTRESFIQQHQSNLQSSELYTEPQITSNHSLKVLVSSLEQKINIVLSSFDSLLNFSQTATEFWSPRLEQKYITAYETATQINFNELLEAARVYNQSIYDYWETINEINVIFNTFSSSLDKVQLNSQITTINEQQVQLNVALKRITLEPVCSQYKQKFALIESMEASYNTKKNELEESQNSFLSTYFDKINRLFNQLGSSDFQILKIANNRGRKVIYDLQIKFNGVNIPTNKVDTVFSESDRRALALCIFLAKIISLSEAERAKAIIVLDDPVTSFDNERITLILNKLDEIRGTVKQLIITTHYKGMAAKVVKKFKNFAKSIKLVLNSDTCSLVEVSNDDLMATTHDIAFDKIKAFVDRETNEDILNTLRPFIEEEIKHRYKKQLLDLGVSKSDFSVWITSLKDNNYITVDMEARLNSIRNSLNTPMHEIGSDALENTRSLAREILDVVYNGLTP